MIKGIKLKGQYNTEQTEKKDPELDIKRQNTQA